MSNNQFIILTPVYNDWEALCRLLPSLDHELAKAGYKATVLVVDDGSTRSPSRNFPIVFHSIIAVDVISLKRNLGHQRAIAVGLSYIENRMSECSVVIMDADGEDDPHDVPRLINACIINGAEKIIFAARSKRSEGIVFALLYHLYRLLHLVLTGIAVRVGNFSIIPSSALKRVVSISELWNHYAAAIHKARLPMELIPSKRGKRLEGSPRMDWVSLIVHGLSAMAVFGDRIGVRLLVVVSAGMCLAIAALALVLGIRLTTNLAIPGWTTYAAGLLFVMLIQMLLVILNFVFVILAARNAANVIPMNDPEQFVACRYRLYG